MTVAWLTIGAAALFAAVATTRPTAAATADNDTDRLTNADLLIDAAKAAREVNTITAADLADWYLVARDVRLAVAARRHNRAARRAALAAYESRLRADYFKMNTTILCEGSFADDLAIFGERLAQAAAELAGEDGRERLTNLRTRVAWADRLAPMLRASWETQTVTFRRYVEATTAPSRARIELAQATCDRRLEATQLAALERLAEQQLAEVRSLLADGARRVDDRLLAQAEANLARARARREAFQGASNRAASALREAIASGQRAVAATEVAYQSETATLWELLQAEQDLADDRLALAELRRDWAGAAAVRAEHRAMLATLTESVRMLHLAESRGGETEKYALVQCIAALAAMSQATCVPK